MNHTHTVIISTQIIIITIAAGEAIPVTVPADRGCLDEHRLVLGGEGTCGSSWGM